jgi:hypothetical protein
MAHEAQLPTTSPADLYKAAEFVARSGRRKTVRLHGKILAIVPQESAETVKARARRGQRRENGFLAAYGTVPPLEKPLTDNEMTEIAAEEAAQEAARAGLPPHADH